MPRKGKKVKRTAWQIMMDGKSSLINSENLSKLLLEPFGVNCNDEDVYPKLPSYSVEGHSSYTMDLLMRDEKHCDAVIETGGEKFKIHKSIFAIYSDYLDKVFTVEMQERYDNIVRLEDTRCDVMKCIIDFIYTGQLSINRENAIELLAAADYLRIEKIKEFSIQFMLRNVDTENCVSIWLCAKTFDLEDLLEISSTVFRANFLSVAREDLQWLTKDQFREIMNCSKASRKSDESAFIAITVWTKCDLENRKETFYAKFQTFDLSLFSKDLLSNIVRNESLISMRAELLHKVVLEILTRLEKAIEREKEANKRIAQLEEDMQTADAKVDRLLKENTRFTERVRELVSLSHQAADHQKAALRKIDLLAMENVGLSEKLVSNARHSALQQRASAKKIESLTKENEKLAEQLRRNLRRAQDAESDLKASTSRVNKLKEENRILNDRDRRNVSIAEQRDRELIAAAKKISCLTAEKERLTQYVQTSIINAKRREEQKIKSENKKMASLTNVTSNLAEMVVQGNPYHSLRIECQELNSKSVSSLEDKGQLKDESDTDKGAAENHKVVEDLKAAENSEEAEILKVTKNFEVADSCDVGKVPEAAKLPEVTSSIKVVEIPAFVEIPKIAESPDAAESCQAAESYEGPDFFPAEFLEVAKCAENQQLNPSKEGELEIEVENLIIEKQRLTRRVEIETLNVRKVKKENLDLKDKVDLYAEENQRLSKTVQKWLKVRDVAKKTQSARKAICRVINDPSKWSWFWRGIHLSGDDRSYINQQLQRIEL